VGKHHPSVLKAKKSRYDRPYEHKKKNPQKPKKEKRMPGPYRFSEIIMSIDGRRIPGPDFDPRVDPRDPRYGENYGRMVDLENALRQAQETMKAQQQFIDGVKDAPKQVATITHTTSDKRCLVNAGGPTLEVNRPLGCGVGSQVYILAQNAQPVTVLPEPLVFGRTVTVSQILGDEVGYEGHDGERFAKVREGIGAIESGDRVRLDPSGMVALVNLGRDRKRFIVHDAQATTWDDIGGLEDAKEAIREAIEFPTKYAETYRAYGQKPSKGILLYGPPGCGKTLLGKAAAHAIGAAEGFIYIKGSELLSKWVGESESQVVAIFDRARAYKRRTGQPAIIFIDEAESILGIRGGTGGVLSGATGNTLQSHLVPSFLAEMDGLDDSGAYVILSTNRPNSLDPAIVRDGRIDRRVRVGRPTKTATADIFRLEMRNRPCESVEALVELAAERIFSDDLAIYELQFDGHPRELVCFRDLLNGAVVAGVVRRAAALAIRRDRDSGACSGIRPDDITHAIEASFEELTGVHHIESISEKIERLGRIPVAVRKANRHAGPEETRFSIPVPFAGAGVQGTGGGAAN
jgi:ATP-dependent 26S proteasome regulatory subunit